VVSNVFSLSKKWFSFLVMMMISGCTSTSPQVSNYYLLESVTTRSKLSSNQQIVLLPIQLSDYLKSANLHVKSSSGQISYSPIDLWAEQPSKMLWRVMQQNLEEQTKHHVLTSFDAVSSCAKIKIQFNELSPTTSGDVVTNGRWFINSSGKTRQTNKFSYTGRIDSDGFSAANIVTIEHLNGLAAELDKKIKSLGLCQ